VHDLLKEWDGEVIRLALLKAHYRNELNWSEDLLRESKSQLDGWYKKLAVVDASKINKKAHPHAFASLVALTDNIESKLDNISGYSALPRRQEAPMFDDLNVVSAIRYISDLTDFTQFDGLESYEQACALVRFGSVFGLLQKDPEEWFTGGISDADKSLAADYDAARAKALEAKSSGDKAAMGAAFKKSDAIRSELSAKGLVLETSADGISKLRKA